MIRLTLVLFALYWLSNDSFARLLFVDKQLSAECTTYNYQTRSCGGGEFRAFTTLKTACVLAGAGDTVVIRGGIFNEQLAPKHSGSENEPLLITCFKSEEVVITGASLAPAIWIYQLSYVTIQGLWVRDVQRWMAVLGSHHIVVRSNVFLNANDAGGSSKTGLFFQDSDNCVIRENVIENSTQDNLALVHCNRNLIEGNRITRASHTLWTLKCSSHNVLRRNYFHNALQKIGEIYDCDNVGYGDFGYEKITVLDSTKFNVVEENIFAFTTTPINASPYSGIQHAGQQCIIRRNVFYNCIGPPIDLTLYADEARNCYGNKIYNNVFYANEFGGMSVASVSGAGYTFHGNVVANNIFYQNKFSQHDTRWQWYATLRDKPVQVMLGRMSDVLFARNNFMGDGMNSIWSIAFGDRRETNNPPQQSLSVWERDHPNLFVANQELEPHFRDTAQRDFRLRAGSPMIDSGAYVAATTSDGAGLNLLITDPTFFSDGFGIVGGDTIQLQNSTERAVIVGIDYSTRTLKLDRALEWKKGAGVALKYNGSGPDLGAFESVTTTNVESDFALPESPNISPNPAEDFITITLPSGEAGLVQIVDIRGQVVLTFSSASAEIARIDISSLSPGVYSVVNTQISKRSVVLLVVCR